MEDVIPYLIWAVIIIAGAISSVNKTKNKREEEARRKAAEQAAAKQAAQHAVEGREAARQAATKRAAADSGSGWGAGWGSSVGTGAGTDWGTSVGTGSGSGQGSAEQGYGDGRVKPAGGTFASVLEELSRKLGEQPSPTVASRPMVTSQPAATSFDYYSLEEEYDAADGRGYRGEYSTEMPEDEVTAYERLATQRAHRSSLAASTAATTGMASASGKVAGMTSGTGGAAVSAGNRAAYLSTNPAVGNQAASDDARTTLQELLGGDFDLRRAVIEAEILTPKYLA